MSTHAAAARAQCLELFSLVLSGQCCGLRMPRTRAARPTARTALSACASTLDYAVLYDNREIQSLVVRISILKSADLDTMRVMRDPRYAVRREFVSCAYPIILYGYPAYSPRTQ